MKKAILILVGLLLAGATSFAADIDLTVGYDTPVPATGGHGKAPIKQPYVALEDYQLSFQSTHPTYIINIVGEEGVVYSTTALAGVASINLPTWLAGTYEIQLVPSGSSYYFYGDITL